mmetsp:Transcript_20837/g.34368  ORF Transcript_20837/g.34368 Transcript_20837/m.34368 type:complete len:458 (+) Transcript_20837:99-1472(+)
MTPNYPVEIGHSLEEEGGAFDEEKINFYPPSLSLPQLQDDNNISIEGSEDDEENDETEKGEAANKKRPGMSKVVCTILALGAAVTTAVVAAVSVTGAHRYAQSQISTSLLSGQSKAGKAEPAYCDRLICGQNFTSGEKITLSEDLFCDDNFGTASKAAKKSRNCAITLEGDAELDCNGYGISQISSLANDALLNCNEDTITLEKTNCGELYYYRGICLSGNAKAKNCRVDTFFDGFYVESGGEIKDSLVLQNRVGIFVNDGPGDSTKISKTTVRGNAQGIDVKQTSTDNKIYIDQVRSNNNVGSDNIAKYGDGFHLYGKEITVKDSEASSNARNGMVIDGAGTTSVDLKGTIFLRHNEASGLATDNINSAGPLNGTLNVDGQVNIYENGAFGLVLRSDTYFDVEVKKGGSLISCENGNKDIWNDGASTFGDDGFTCGTTKGGTGSPLPACASCPLCS